MAVMNRNPSNWSSLSDYNDEVGAVANKTFDSSNPNDDIWRKFSLPLTPPSSPPRSFGETSDCSDTIDDIANRLQDVCDSLDCAFFVDTKTVSSNLRSKLISDCMWSGNHVEVQGVAVSTITVPQKKETEEDLYPTPCASPLPSVIVETTDYPSSNECVNPITVFPLPPQDNLACILAAQSDTDEEIDVVTVDSFVTTPPTISVGSKRKQKHSNKSSPPLKVRNTSTTPVFQRTKSVPARLNSSTTEPKERVLRKHSFQDESDPETRRATHNVLERKRRIDLKNSFERLRECIPNLEKVDKTPKVIVLKKAAVYVEDLNRESIKLEEEKRLLILEKEQLTRRLDMLVKQDVELLI